MTLATDEIVPIGTKVKVSSGAPGVVEGYGTVRRDPDGPTNIGAESEEVTVYEIEITENFVGPGDRVQFEGERMLLYRAAFTVLNEFDVKVVYEFRSRVRADNVEAALDKLTSELVETLTFDGDDDAPDTLVDLQMRRMS